MFNISNLWKHKDNISETVEALLSCLNVGYVGYAVDYYFAKHPFSPSFQAVSDLLDDYSIEHQAVFLKDKNKILQIKTPCIVQVKIEEKEYFSLLVETRNDNFVCTDPLQHNKKRFLSKDDFVQIFTGYVMLCQTSAKSGDKSYSLHKKEVRLINFKEYLVVFALPLFFFFSIIWQIAFGKVFLAGIIYQVMLFVGIILGLFSLAY